MSDQSNSNLTVNGSASNDNKDYMLTTIDNPYNPWLQFDEWYNYDELKGYHTSSYLARVCRTSSELSEEEQTYAQDQAIDEIVKENILGIYVKIAKDGSKSFE